MTLALLAMLAEQLDTDPCQWSTFLGAAFSRTFSSHLTALQSSLLDPSSSSAAFFCLSAAIASFRCDYVYSSICSFRCAAARVVSFVCRLAAPLRACSLRFSLFAAPRRAWCLFSVAFTDVAGTLTSYLRWRLKLPLQCPLATFPYLCLDSLA